MSDIKLGYLAPVWAQRDAIHVAVAPVVAYDELEPGEHVGLFPDGKASRLVKKHIGIVDPFLKRKVSTGDRFYILLYQNTVTSLRHEWTHPDFVDVIKTPAVQSEVWLRKFAEDHNVTYAALMECATGLQNNGDSMLVDEQYAEDQPDEFWDHYFNVTGKRGKGWLFRCAC